MISALFKKTYVIYAFVIFCVMPLKAEEINAPQAEFRRLSTSSCDPDLLRFRGCVEAIINEKLDDIECELKKEFKDRNEFIANRICSLGIRLKEFIICQEKARDAAIEEFFACNLDRVETDVEEFVVRKIDCILSLLCQRFEDLKMI